ncbi:MAG: hypothetical protein ACLQDL_16130 [Spirochaetia bacterium]
MQNARTTFRSARDPAESWELPSPEGEGGPYHRGVCDIFPFTPRRTEDVSKGAHESLNEICGIESLRQVFVIPGAVRKTGFGEQKVISPEGVMALGARAVGLWTAKPEPGVKIAIPLERLSAIEEVTILLYGRLSFLSLDGRLTIRYNTLARFALEPALRELRKRLAGAPQPLPCTEECSLKVPIKWETLIRSSRLRFHEGAPVAFLFATAPGCSHGERERGQLLAVNPHELVYMCDPPEALHNYGEDSFIVPRPRITRVRVRESYLEVASNGARFTLTMAPELREAAARWFA